MIGRALAALALGGLLSITFPAGTSPVEASRQPETSPEIIERYRQALATDPDNLSLHYLLGVALLQNGLNVEAFTELTTAYPAYQESVEAHYNLALAALRLNDLVSAELFLDQAISLGADKMQGIYPLATLYFNMAITSQNHGDLNEAIRYFHRALFFDPERYEVYRQLGDLYSQQGEIDLAIKAFHSYLEKFPDDPVSRDYLFALEFNRAQDYLAAENFTKARQGFSAALELQPGSPTALYYLGYLEYIDQQPQQAALLLGEAYNNAGSELQQTIKPLLYNTALSLRESRKFNLALDAVSALAEQKNALFNELNLAGILALDTNQYRLAQQYLLRAIELNPKHSGARQNLIIAEAGAFGEWLTLSRQRLKEDQLSAAEKALAKAAQLQPRSSKVITLKNRISQQRLENAADQFFKARIALESGDLPVALDHANAGLAIKPNDRDGLVLRQEISDAMAVDLDKLLAAGLQDLQSGNLGSADLAFRKILAIAPQHQETLAAKDQLIQARQEQSLKLQRDGQRAIDSGQAESAIQLFNQLLAMDPENRTAKQGLNSARQMLSNRVDELIRNGHQAADRGEYTKARQWFEQARSIEDTRRTQTVLQALSREITAKADEYAEQANRAVVKKDLSQAKKLYAQALALDPGHEASVAGQKALAEKTEQIITTRLKHADKAFRKGAYPEAIKLYRAILDLDANQTAAIAGLKRCREAQAEELAQLVESGETALENGDFETAEEMLSKALQQDAYHKQAQQLRQKLDRMQQAGAQPGDEQKLYLQGVAYYTQGKYTEAIKSWETVLLLDPEHEKSRQNITKTRLKMQQLKEFSGG